MGKFAATRFKPSFPQPDDIQEEDENEIAPEDSTGNDRTRGESAEEHRVGPRIIKSIDAARDVQRQEEDIAQFGFSHPSVKRIQNQTRPRNSPIATGSSPVVRMSSDDNVPEAYFTAPDVEPQQTTPPARALSKGKNKSQHPRVPESGGIASSSSLPYRNSYATTDTSVLATETGSQSSLIPHNKQPSSISKSSRKLSETQPEELQPQEPCGETDRTEAELAESQRNHGSIGRVISDRVRFGVEEGLESGQGRIQKHLGLSNEARSTRRQKRQVRRNGEVLRAEKMLVRIEVTAQTVPDLYNDNASLKIETRPVENWREYLVVCRQGYDEQVPYILQFYKTRVIPQVQGAKVKRKYAHEVRLGQGQANVNLFSSLDKTIVLWHPTKANNTHIFIMRARSAAHSVEWYTFIRKALGWKQPSTLFVHVPDLDVSLVLQNPFAHLAKTQQDENEGALLSTMSEEQAVSSGIIRTCMETLSECVEWSQILDIWTKSEKMGLAWRRYDRLEWIQGGNEERMYGTMAMRTSHDLELRPKRHYPTSTVLESCKTQMKEPSPIEGFLILLTSQQGTHRRWGRNFSKRLYFYSEDQYLCFCKPTKASTPPAPKLPTIRNSHALTSPETIKGSPVMYPVDPYPVEDGEISWLRSGSNKPYIKHRDQAAFAETQRNKKNLSQAEGYINLCRVSEIRALSAVAGAEGQQNGNGGGESQNHARHSSFSGSFSSATGNDSKQAKMDRIFELVLDDGLVVRLQAYSKQTRDAWVGRMNQLSTYWKARTKADITTLKTVRQRNLEKLDIDEEQESIIGQFAQKWEVARAETSPELFNVCGPSGCRAIKVCIEPFTPFSPLKSVNRN
ncbi:PH domain-containing protein [Arthroderma uncinatum]|uniref:PH domain-containing protein n=1 Tax=Arthroderma uncinatum TaxID=74035 RepID=UPI00144A4E24|nr:PH domain-containing protein [Arthroderma uncinatum]KAF3491019.1 PH domain-containing protein [Arthroderma uncinatum]